MQTIRRGTTPTVRFTTTVTSADIDLIYITFYQNGRTVFEKDGTNVVWNESGFSIHLSQDETLKLAEGFAKVQIRAKLQASQATATQILVVGVEDVLKDGVI